MTAPEPVVRIVRGGAVDDAEHAAILTAVTRALIEQDQGTATVEAAWAWAGRLEGTGLRTIRSRSALPRG